MGKSDEFIYDSETSVEVFKNGERVMCVNTDEFYYKNTNNGTGSPILETTINTLEYGKIYTVVPSYIVSGFTKRVSKNVLYISLDGMGELYHVHRFRSLNDIRQEKINKLINGK